MRRKVWAWSGLLIGAALTAGCTGWPATGLFGEDLATLNNADLAADLSGSSSPNTDVRPVGEPSCLGTALPSDSVHAAMFEALNRYRRENGLSPLIYSGKLEQLADAHARDLWERSFFDHINPDGLGPGDRALQAGFCHEYVGENIAAGQTSVESVMRAWKNSPSHDRNMLLSQYVYVGMGFSRDPNGRLYWAQEFAFDVP